MAAFVRDSYLDVMVVSRQRAAVTLESVKSWISK